ncbi:F0F1 ATP synthase subunit A [Reyranella sp.]|uniref:F0F1 ATP synthase subunit A n=1 Tax=Reyranella sp. TaxID=1929291 RepID=UPI00120797FA|nr:F0F1 ATP synthase subunit A [Reyranella sp.]TAJ82942.1 MAG: F0F1 ATP synthase subunit A [Reyranella sp.]
MASPVEQFAIQNLSAPLFSIGGNEIAITNSAVFMFAAVAVSSVLLVAGASKAAMIPGRFQAMSELFYEFIANMIRDNVGSAGKKFFPFIFTLFIFTLFGNLLGLIPYGFTFTSHIAVTFFMAAVVFIAVTLIGIFKHGLHFFSLFFPHGAPLFTAPILIPIELVSYLSRPISLSVRLFANMTVGHVLLKVLAGFVVALGIFGVIPLAVLVAITALEVLIALLQAYIFTILCCIYLNDALHLH